MSKAVHYAKEEKRRQEKLARKKAEAFRSMLKALTPSVTVESTWDNVSCGQIRIRSILGSTPLTYPSEILSIPVELGRVGESKGRTNTRVCGSGNG